MTTFSGPQLPARSRMRSKAGEVVVGDGEVDVGRR
jgi:hypothetical protein